MIALTAWLALAADEEGLRRHALLVGHNDGGPTRPVLKFAHRDAERLGEVLTELGGVEPADAWLLTDPTVADLEAAFEDLGRALAELDGQRTEVVFYYSGHSDETGLILGEEVFEYSRLRATVNDLPADVRIAILDSCASGTLIRTKGGQVGAPFLVDESSRVDGFAYITSSSEDEAAQEADRLEGSFFTHFLTLGLRGAADVSRDQRVTLGEAYSYAFAETLRRTETSRYGPQHAAHDFQLQGTGEVVLADLQRSEAALVLDEDLGGTALVRDDSGRLVAEVGQLGGQAVELAVPAGTYRVVVVEDGKLGEHAVEVPSGSRVLVRASDLDALTAEATVARGDVEGAPETPPVWTHGRFSVGAAPGDELLADRIVFGLGSATSGTLDGASLGMGVGRVSGDAVGYLGHLGVVQVGGELRGAGTAFGYGRADAVEGALVALGATQVDRSLRGLQGSVGFNGAEGDLRGAQLAVGANVARGTGAVAQLAMAANVARGPFDGLQLSQGVNVADQFRGAQLGLINVGARVHGAQIGLINVGGHVYGTQIGLINVAKDVRGMPLGLLSFVREGRHGLSVFTTEADPINLDLKVGGRSGLYTVLGAGGTPDSHGWLGAGLGVHVPAGALWIDLDGSFQGYHALNVEWGSMSSGLVRGRLLLGWRLARHFQPFAGVSFAGKVLEGERPVRVPAEWYAPEANPERVLAWPGFVAGVEF